MNSFFKRNQKFFKCVKSLHKQTYRKNAFTKDRTYVLDYEDKEFYFIIDEELNSFSVSKERLFGLYFVDDYFVERK